MPTLRERSPTSSLVEKRLLVGVVVLTAAWLVDRHVSDHRPGPCSFASAAR
jgi:hypothetical protein